MIWLIMFSWCWHCIIFWVVELTMTKPFTPVKQCPAADPFVFLEDTIDCWTLLNIAPWWWYLYMELKDYIMPKWLLPLNCEFFFPSHFLLCKVSWSTYAYQTSLYSPKPFKTSLFPSLSIYMVFGIFGQGFLNSYESLCMLFLL